MALSETNFKGCTLFRKGKVRDVYDAGDALVLVASDRVSAFDVVLPTPIPDKVQAKQYKTSKPNTVSSSVTPVPPKDKESTPA